MRPGEPGDTKTDRSSHRSGGVPLSRRNLFAERRRLLASMIGVGLAVMLILLLDGLWAGLRQQATVYTDRAGADLYVLQPGIRDLTAGASTIPLTAVDRVKSDPEVAWATPVRTAYVILTLHGRKVAVYVVGSGSPDHGGPWSLVSGRRPRADDEVTVGALVARRHGIGVGDQISVMGTRLRVVGTSDSSGFMLDYVFVTHRALTGLVGTPDATSAILIGTSNPAGVARRLRSDGLNVLARDTVAQNNLALATGIFGSPIRLMVGIGLAAGTLIIALTAYTVINERRREYGILAALGATRARLVKLALVQTLALAGMGLVAGLVLFIVGRVLIVGLRPQFQVVLTPGAVGRAAAAALLMALLAAILPARRLAALEPAAAFRSQT